MLVVEHDNTWFADVAPKSYRDPEARVRAFLTLFYQAKFFGQIVLLNNGYLRDAEALGFDKGGIFNVAGPAVLADRYSILRACTSRGHLSVLFVPKNHQELLAAFLGLGFYQSGNNTEFGTGTRRDPLGNPNALRNYLQSENGRAVECLLSFSHDAEQFYEVYPHQGTDTF